VAGDRRGTRDMETVVWWRRVQSWRHRLRPWVKSQLLCLKMGPVEYLLMERL